MRALAPVERAWLKFVVVFALVFLGGSKLHQATRDRTAPLLVGVLSTRASVSVINWLTPDEHTTAVNARIQGRSSITVGQGCDGVDGVLVLVAAVLAFPLSWKRKLGGLAVGVLLLYVANLARIVTLYYVFSRAPDAFAFMHEYVGQTFIIILGFAFFMAWSGAAQRLPSANHAA